MSARPFLRALALAGVFGVASAAAAQPTRHVLLDNGPTDARVNVVFLSEGYTAPELPSFVQDAQGALQGLLSTPPYSTYPSAFNAFALAVASAESGSDHPAQGVARSTYFDSYYDCQGIQRLICIPSAGQNRVTALLQDLQPDYDIVIVLVNDPEYGGSGGVLSVVSTHPSSAEIAIHEVGHSFAGLGDEYGGSGSPSAHETFNTTQETRREAIRWAHWIEPTTPIPTPNTSPYNGVVGLFEGAAYYDVGWFRPQRSCMMRTLGAAFCAVCHERHVGAMYDLVRPIASALPAAPTVSLAPGDSVVLAIETLIPAEWLGVEWRLDGVPIESSGTALVLQGDALPEGTTRVSVHVTDQSPRVRATDLLPLLRDSVAWNVTRSATAGEAPASGEALSLRAHPAPMRTATTFTFRLPAAGPVRLVVYDVLGREVATVLSDVRAAGQHEVRWNPSTPLPAGVYVCRLVTDRSTLAQPLTVVR